MLPRMKFPVFLESLGGSGIILRILWGIKIYERLLLSGMEFAALHIRCFLGWPMTANQDCSPSTFHRKELLDTNYWDSKPTCRTALSESQQENSTISGSCVVTMCNLCQYEHLCYLLLWCHFEELNGQP